VIQMTKDALIFKIDEEKRIYLYKGKNNKYRVITTFSDENREFNNYHEALKYAKNLI